MTQGLRRLVRAGEVSPGRAAEAIADLVDLDLHRHAHLDLLTYAWKVRENVTAYDAVYVALAEALHATVVTCDRPLAKAAGHNVRSTWQAPQVIDLTGLNEWLAALDDFRNWLIREAA